MDPGSGRGADLSEAAAVHADIDALEPAIDASSDWKAVVLVGLLVRLRELTDLVHDIMALRRQIRAEEPRLAKLTFAQGETILTLKHRDHVMALHSALATILAIGLISAFWIAIRLARRRRSREPGGHRLRLLRRPGRSGAQHRWISHRGGHRTRYRRNLPVCHPAAGA